MIYVPFMAALRMGVNPGSGGWTHLRGFGFNSILHDQILTLDLDGSL